MNIDINTPCNKCRICPIGIYAKPKWRDKISKKKYQNLYPKGRYIFFQGNPVHGMFLIQQGKVKIVTEVSNNKAQIVRLGGNGHILGRQGRTRDIYANSAVALEPSQVCFINNEDIEELLLANPELTLKILSYYSGELRKAEKRIKLLAQLTVREKIAEAILYIQSVFQSDESGIINAVITLREIAEICGASAEQVSREISILKKEQVIDLENKLIRIIDQNQLIMIGAQRT